MDRPDPCRVGGQRGSAQTLHGRVLGTERGSGVDRARRPDLARGRRLSRRTTPMTGFTERQFADRALLAQALAGDVATRLRAAIDERGVATLALSGGTTPVL